MKTTNVLRTALWATVAFAEAGALAAFFLGGKWKVIDELTGGQPVLFGIEMLVLAGLATWAVLRKPVSKPLVRAVMAMNGLLFGFLLYRLETTPDLSAAGTELLIIDGVVVAAMLVAQFVGLRSDGQPERNEAYSSVPFNPTNLS
ncbi:MAG: hypothetical protein H7Z75_09325 [Ferruginibacter sp.]|nr:hypothetical protein [Cytophagales bacterium]